MAPEAPLPDEHYISSDVGGLLVFSAQIIHCVHYSKKSGRKALDPCIVRRHELLTGSVDVSVFPSQEGCGRGASMEAAFVQCCACNQTTFGQVFG